jgi:flagellar basal body-associated protein FliL
MKKKVLIIVVAVVVVVGGVVAAMALTGGGATEEDHKQGEETADEVDKALENADTDMPESDPSLDSLENSIELEEFDPNDI